MRICMYGASSETIAQEYLAAGEALGRELARRGHGLVFGGGAKGMMGAAARGVTAVGGEIIGVAPGFFHVDGVLYEKCTELIKTDTMRQRKERMENLADAFLMVPGSIGTWEEFLEIFTLRQLKQHEKPIAVWNLLHYFDPMEALIQSAIDRGFLKASCRTLYGIFETPEEALDYLEACPQRSEEAVAYR